jgi:hypothetical protein
MKTVELRAKLPDDIADRMKETLRGDEDDRERLRQLVAEASAPGEEETLTFRTPNLTLEEYAALPVEEKSRICREAEAANREWIERELQRRGALQSHG